MITIPVRNTNNENSRKNLKNTIEFYLPLSQESVNNINQAPMFTTLYKAPNRLAMKIS